MTNELRAAALALYKPPFRYECGYIWDANNEMVADDDRDAFVARIRGWGTSAVRLIWGQTAPALCELCAGYRWLQAGR